MSPSANATEPFLAPRRLSERALTAGIQAAGFGGMSTRTGDDRVHALGMTGYSQSPRVGVVRRLR